MEFNFKSNSPYSYMRYGGYQGKYKENEYYLVPKPEESINIREVYDMFSQIDSALVDLLNMGKICTDLETYTAKFTCAYHRNSKGNLIIDRRLKVGSDVPKSINMNIKIPTQKYKKK